MTSTQPDPVGTWRVAVSTARDAQQSGAAQGLLIFQPDHTVLSLLPGPGAGTWRPDGRGSISFSFVELLGYDPDGRITGYAAVSQHATLSAASDAFQSAGQGGLYDAGGSHITTTRTTTRATRVA
jgi:hypothetical protein